MPRNCYLYPLAQTGARRDPEWSFDKFRRPAQSSTNSRSPARFMSMIGALLISCTIVTMAASAEEEFVQEFVGKLATAVTEDVAKTIGLEETQQQQLLELLRNRDNDVT